MKEWQRMPAYWFASRRHYFVKNHGRTYAAFAWSARVLGSAIHLLRCKVTGRPSQDPAHFLGDLTRFGLSPQRETSPTVIPRRPSEDQT
jgi:hypothetical protein